MTVPSTEIVCPQCCRCVSAVPFPALVNGLVPSVPHESVRDGNGYAECHGCGGYVRYEVIPDRRSAPRTQPAASTIRVGWAILSPREIEVARLVAEDLADKTIASILQISCRTVNRYLDNIGRKICAQNSPYSRRRCIARWVESHERPG